MNDIERLIGKLEMARRNRIRIRSEYKTNHPDDVEAWTVQTSYINGLTDALEIVYEIKGEEERNETMEELKQMTREISGKYGIEIDVDIMDSYDGTTNEDGDEQCYQMTINGNGWSNYMTEAEVKDELNGIGNFMKIITKGEAK